MSCLHFEIEFSDLSDERQEGMIEDVKKALLDSYEEEGEEYLKNKDWIVKPLDWAEAYCRIYAIDWGDWNDLEEGSKEWQALDWKYNLEQYAEEQAKEACFKGMHNMEAEIEI